MVRTGSAAQVGRRQHLRRREREREVGIPKSARIQAAPQETNSAGSVNDSCRKRPPRPRGIHRLPHPGAATAEPNKWRPSSRAGDAATFVPRADAHPDTSESPVPRQTTRRQICPRPGVTAKAAIQPAMPEPPWPIWKRGGERTWQIRAETARLRP